MKIGIQIILCMLVATPTCAQVILHKTENINDHYIIEFSSEAPDNRSAALQLRYNRRQALKSLRARQKNNIQRLQQDTAHTDLKILRKLWLKRSLAVSVSQQYLPLIKRLPYVTAVRKDAQFKIGLQGITTLSQSGEIVQDNLQRVGIDALWAEGYRGQGVVVAVLDSGIDVEHEDLKSRWRGGENSWFDAYQQQPLPRDLSGHGTAVASIVLGGDASGSFIGMAPNAQWIGARIFDDDGNSSESAISETLQWVLDPDGNPDTDDFPDVVQNSWGLDTSEGSCVNPFETELQAIDALGIDQVFAVGNSGLSGPGGGGFSSYLTPSFDSHVISVGAVKRDDTLLFSSSRGPDLCGSSIIPALVAPGELVKTSDLTFGGFDTDNTTLNDGTSFSSPHVSGALALLRSKFFAVNHLQYRQTLFDSATDLGDQNDYGLGLVQVDDAMLLMQGQSTPLRQNEVSFSAANYQFLESDSKPVVTVIRAGDISSSASVDLGSTDGTAGANDFIPVQVTLDFAPGESIKVVDILLVNDSDAESDETFNLVLSQNTNVNLGARTSLTVTIKDDDSVVEEDEIGGASTGLIELMTLTLLWAGRRFRR